MMEPPRVEAPAVTVDWGGLVTVPLLGLVGQPAEGWAGVGQGMLTVS